MFLARAGPSQLRILKDVLDGLSEHRIDSTRWPRAFNWPTAAGQGVHRHAREGGEPGRERPADVQTLGFATTQSALSRYVAPLVRLRLAPAQPPMRHAPGRIAARM